MWGAKTLCRFICACHFLSWFFIFQKIPFNPVFISYKLYLQWHFRFYEPVGETVCSSQRQHALRLTGKWEQAAPSTQEATSHNFTFCRLVWIWKNVWLISGRTGCCDIRRSQVSQFVGLQVVRMMSADASELTGLWGWGVGSQRILKVWTGSLSLCTY